jgi:hypothetical protein
VVSLETVVFGMACLHRFEFVGPGVALCFRT